MAPTQPTGMTTLIGIVSCLAASMPAVTTGAAVTSAFPHDVALACVDVGAAAATSFP